MHAPEEPLSGDLVSIDTEKEIPVIDPPIGGLIYLKGQLAGAPVNVLKDDGCNTNVLSASFVRKHREKLDVRKTTVEILHSSSKETEITNEIVYDTTITIGDHSYRSNWAISSTRHDVLLGMPWHETHEPAVDYKTKTVTVDGTVLPSSFESIPESLRITNLSTKKFRSIVRKKGSAAEVYMVKNVTAFLKYGSEEKKVSECLDTDLQNLLTEYEDVFIEDLPDGLPPERSVDHAIELNQESSPPFRPSYHLSPAELIATKEYITKLLKSGKIRPSKSPFGAPLFFVRQNGQLRGVIDYRALNLLTKKNNAPIPRIDEILDRLGRAAVFSKMDMKTGFHQIRIRPSDVEKTAFNSKYGHFEFLVMPMGLCNAPATFQTLMNSIFYDHLDDFVVVYIDDLLVFSKNREDHLRHLEIVLSRLKAHQLYIGRAKCHFMASEIDFLGLIVSQQGIHVDPERIRAVQEWPRPKTVSDLRSFVGLLQYFRRFIKDFSSIAAPLTDLTRKHSGMHLWDEQCTSAFKDLKSRLTSAPILVSPRWDKQFNCHVDASQYAVGGTLTQTDDDGQERVVAYYSKRLNDAEENYTSNDRELLGLVYFLKRFRCYLEGSTFEVITDNQVLSNFLTKKNLSRRETRWLDLFAEFNLDKLTLKQGKIHVLGDALSRIPQESEFKISNVELSSIIPEDIFIAHYPTDQAFGSIYKALSGDLPSDPIEERRITRLLPLFTLKDGILYYQNKKCVPRKVIRNILYQAHDSKTGGHFSVTKTLSRLEHFHWKTKTRDVKRYCDGCHVCQQSKDSRVKPFGVPQPLEIPTRRWGSIGTDFIVGLPVSKLGHDAITTYVDRFTKRVHFLPTNSTATSKQVATDFFDVIFKHHGLPDSIVSDRDPRFTAHFWKELMDLCDIQTKMSTSHHPQTDGSSEITNRMIENYLRCFCDHNQQDWDRLLTSAEFAYNSSDIPHMNISPFELDIGWKPKSPLELLSSRSDYSTEGINDLRKLLLSSFEDAVFAHRLAQARQAAYNSKKYRPPSYVVGDEVWLSRKYFTDSASSVQKSKKLGVKRYGPFRIIELIGKNAVRLDLPSNIQVHPVVHVEHTARVQHQPSNISQETPPRPAPIPQDDGTSLIEVDRILHHRKRGKGYQWLAAYTGAPLHEARWQPTSDFLDPDGTITKAFHDYITQNGLLPHLHNIAVVGNGKRKTIVKQK